MLPLATKDFKKTPPTQWFFSHDATHTPLHHPSTTLVYKCYFNIIPPLFSINQDCKKKKKRNSYFLFLYSDILYCFDYFFYFPPSRSALPILIDKIDSTVHQKLVESRQSLIYSEFIDYLITDSEGRNQSTVTAASLIWTPFTLYSWLSRTNIANIASQTV